MEVVLTFRTYRAVGLHGFRHRFYLHADRRPGQYLGFGYHTAGDVTASSDPVAANATRLQPRWLVDREKRPSFEAWLHLPTGECYQYPSTRRRPHRVFHMTRSAGRASLFTVQSWRGRRSAVAGATTTSPDPFPVLRCRHRGQAPGRVVHTPRSPLDGCRRMRRRATAACGQAGHSCR